MTDLDYLKLSKPAKMGYNFLGFLKRIPMGFVRGVQKLFLAIWHLLSLFGANVKDVFLTFIHGDWKTRLSYLVMGFGNCARGQWLRGILFFVFQTVFNLYMFNFGLPYLAKFSTLGDIPTTKKGRVTVYGDNSFFILLYGILTIFFILAFIYTWRVNVRQNKLGQQYLKEGRKLQTSKQDLQAMADEQFLVRKFDKDGVTHTEVTKLNREQRIAELARMVGGADVESESSIRHADQMLVDAAARKAVLRAGVDRAASGPSSE